MTNSTVGSVLYVLTPQMAQELASRFGGTPAGVQNGIGTSVMALICGIAARSADSSFVARLFNLIHESESEVKKVPDLPRGIETNLSTDLGDEFASMVLGSRQTVVEEMIGRHSGLGASTGSELMSLAAPLTLGVLEHQIYDRGLNVSSFAKYIKSEAMQLSGMLPVAINNALFSGFIPSTDTPLKITFRRSPLVKEGLALAGMVILGMIAWSLSFGCNRGQQLAPTKVAETMALPGSLGEFVKRRLPDGTELNIPRVGIENKLIDFIEDPSRPVDKTTWFDFDRLTFDTGAATLQPFSSDQLQNVAELLKAYPRVNVKIGGYTDDIGNKEANLKLSRDRAENVVHELLSRGIDPSRIQAEGYGEEHPVADNATEEGRQKNRRISLLITAK